MRRLPIKRVILKINIYHIIIHVFLGTIFSDKPVSAMTKHRDFTKSGNIMRIRHATPMAAAIYGGNMLIHSFSDFLWILHGLGVKPPEMTPTFLLRFFRVDKPQ
jgi:hypothetical protein